MDRFLWKQFRIKIRHTWKTINLCPFLATPTSKARSKDSESRAQDKGKATLFLFMPSRILSCLSAIHREFSPNTPFVISKRRFTAWYFPCLSAFSETIESNTKMLTFCSEFTHISDKNLQALQNFPQCLQKILQCFRVFSQRGQHYPSHIATFLLPNRNLCFTN